MSVYNRSNASRMSMSRSSFAYGNGAARSKFGRRGYKKRFYRHPMFRNIRLKPLFDVNSRVVSADYFLTMTAATNGTEAVMMVTGDGAWSSSGQAVATPLVLGYFSDARFDSCAAGFKEYTIVGVKVTYTPHRVVTAAVNAV